MELLISLTDNELLNSTKDLISKERALTTQILHQINEIEARRLHSKIGFSSLHECLVKHFHYSDGAAHRRISAARLLKRLPEAVAPALEQGQVNLTTIAAVQDFLVAEKKDFKRAYSAAETSRLITNIAGKSRAQCEQVFQGLSPQRAHAPRPEFTRAVQAQRLEIRFTADQALQAKLARLREILSHHPDVMQSYAALIDTMATKLLKRIDPLVMQLAKSKIPSQSASAPKAHSTPEYSRKRQTTTTPQNTNAQTAIATSENAKARKTATPPPETEIAEIAPLLQSPPALNHTQNAPDSSGSNEQASPRKLNVSTENFPNKRNLSSSFTSTSLINITKNRYIPAAMRREVYNRHQGQCCYVENSHQNRDNEPSQPTTEDLTNRRCTARHFLHIDHTTPLALGGQTIVDNLRLLCAAHNQLAAIHSLGSNFMARHLNKGSHNKQHR